MSAYHDLIHRTSQLLSSDDEADNAAGRALHARTRLVEKSLLASKQLSPLTASTAPDVMRSYFERIASYVNCERECDECGAPVQRHYAGAPGTGSVDVCVHGHESNDSIRVLEPWEVV
jgi:hypothetical protein